MYRVGAVHRAEANPLIAWLPTMVYGSFCGTERGRYV